MPRKMIDEICGGCLFAKKCSCSQDHVTGCELDTPHLDRESSECGDWADRKVEEAE